MMAATLSGIFVMFILLQAGNFTAQPRHKAKEPPTVNEIVIQLAKSSHTKLNEERTYMLPRRKTGKSQSLTQQNEWNEAASARRLTDLTAGTHQDCFQHSSPASTRCRKGTTSKPKRSLPYEPKDSYRHLESQKLTDEIMNLMNMDYPKRGKPGGKPPINNYEPFSKQHTKP